MRGVGMDTAPAQEGLDPGANMVPRGPVPHGPDIGATDIGSLLSRVPPWLGETSEWVRAHFGLDPLAALMLTVGAVGAASGPVRRLRLPGGDRIIYPALDLLLVGGPGCEPYQACRSLLGPVAGEVETIAGRLALSRRQRRFMLAEARHGAVLLRMRYDELHREAEQMRAEVAAGKMPSVVRTPCGMEDVHLERDEREALGKYEEARHKMGLFELGLRPVVRTSGISGALVARWTERTFDGHVVDLLPDGDAILRFLSGPPREMRDVLGFLDRLRRGDRLVCQGADQHWNAGASLLWCCGAGELSPVLGRIRVADGSLARRLLVLPVAGPATGTVRRPEPPPEDWRHNVAKVIFEWRLDRDGFTFALSPGAAESYGALGQDPTGPDPALVARIALALNFCHTPAPPPEAIPSDTFLLAAEIAGEALARHRAATEAAVPAPASLRSNMAVTSGQIEAMVAKLRTRGPCNRRDLFRRFHRQKSSELTPILDAAMRMGLVVEDNKLLKAAATADCQRVSVSAGAG